MHFFFAEGNRKTILQALIYAVANGDGITKVIGEVGSGKTLLSRLLAQSLPDTFEVLYLLNPRIPPEKILYAIAIELGLEVDHTQDKVRLLHILHNRLLELHELNKQTILLIDEAQSIPLETLEELRMLSNLETGCHKLLQVVLFGQPELDQNLNRHEVRQIKERIIHGFYLPRLTVGEVARYLDFRLQKAGYQGAFPFSSVAVRMIALKSDGFLRRINVLADKCLLAAFSRQTKKINCSLVLKVIFEGKSLTNISIASVGVIILVVFGLMMAMENSSWQQVYEQIDTLLEQKIAPVEVNMKPEKANNLAKVVPEEPSVDMIQMPKGYAIKLMQVELTEEEAVNDAIARMIPVDFQNRIYFYEHGFRIYHVLMGNFSRFSEAQLFIKRLPGTLISNKPYIVKVSEVFNKYQQSPETIQKLK